MLAGCGERAGQRGFTGAFRIQVAARRAVIFHFNREKTLPGIRDVIAATARELSRDLEGIGIQLDGTEASLAKLDEAIAAIWGTSSPPEDVFDGMAWGYGCYVADVIHRHHAGEWQPSDDIGYEFILSTTVANPWVWVEKRFQVGERLAAKYRLVFG